MYTRFSDESVRYITDLMEPQRWCNTTLMRSYLSAIDYRLLGLLCHFATGDDTKTVENTYLLLVITSQESLDVLFITLNEICLVEISIREVSQVVKYDKLNFVC